MLRRERERRGRRSRQAVLTAFSLDHHHHPFALPPHYLTTPDRHLPPSIPSTVRLLPTAPPFSPSLSFGFRWRRDSCLSPPAPTPVLHTRPAPASRCPSIPGCRILQPLRPYQLLLLRRLVWPPRSFQLKALSNTRSLQLTRRLQLASPRELDLTSLHLPASHSLSLLQPSQDRGDIALHHRGTIRKEAFVTGSHAKPVLRERSRTGTSEYKRRLLHGHIYIHSFTSLSSDRQRSHPAHFIAITTAV